MNPQADKIVIHHAYNGFLYAPIFLAKELGLFSENCDLVWSRGDREAIQALCEDGDSHKRNWFAICDPLSEHLQFAVPRGPVTERICLVGTIINTAPIWLYNIHPKIGLLRSETDLCDHRDKLQKIVTYPDETTGFLFGQRIKRDFLDHASITPVPFGSEFDNVDEQTLVVTSDILRVLSEDGENARIADLTKRINPIIFHYPERGPTETREFLFTGILTRRQVVLKENLDVLLAVMGAIQKAIHYLKREHVNDLHVGILVDRFKPQLSALGLIQPAHQEACVREALRQMARAGFLWEELTPSENIFRNAEQEWSRIAPTRTAVHGDYIQKLPSIMLSADRLQRQELHNAALDRMPSKALADHAKVQLLFANSLADPAIQNSAIDQATGEALETHPKVKAIVAQRVDETKATVVGLSQSPRSKYSLWDQLLATVYGIPLAACALHFYIKYPNIELSSENLLGVGVAVVAMLAMPVLGVLMSIALQSGKIKTFRWLAGGLYVGAVGLYVGSYQIIKSIG